MKKAYPGGPHSKYFFRQRKRSEKKRWTKHKNKKTLPGCNHRYEEINGIVISYPTCHFCGVDLTLDRLNVMGCNTFYHSCVQHDYLREKYNKKVNGMFNKYGWRNTNWPRTPFLPPLPEQATEIAKQFNPTI